MKWFKGTIPEAIQTSKETRTVFVVYISGEDEISKKMDDTWEDAQISLLCQSANVVAIRLAAKSEECGFFSQIYPVVVVPATFFIGENGVPLEVTGGFVAAGDFTHKINSVLMQHKKQTSVASPGGPSDDAVPASAPSSTPEEATPATHIEQTVSDQMSSSEPASPNTPAGSAETESTPADVAMDTSDVSAAQKEELSVKVNKARELMEQKRLEKIEKTKEEMKLKEKNRRELAKDVQKLKQFQEEQKWKEAKDEIRKDKEEDMKAKQRIREQIARDREERSARYKKEKEQHESAKEEARKTKLLEQQTAAVQRESKKSETARLQVRLPDGSSLTQQFPSSDPLQSVYNFVQQHMGGDIRLSTTYPRRTFSDEDMSTSLASLLLAPTATIIALPVRAHTSTHTSVTAAGGGRSFLSMILSPFLMIWNFISMFLFGSSSQSSQESSSSASSSTTPEEELPDQTRPSRDRPQTAYKRRTPATGPSGKVYRMSDMKKDDDDDMNTWNGNSTQQM
ncbi:hypothetical protein ScPMuIL_013355 [Solemya velum]